MPAGRTREHTAPLAAGGCVRTVRGSSRTCCGLPRHAAHDDARAALSAAVNDPDADVRAYAGRAVR